ncbi:hypothetical protein EV356DRAFT_457832, partial [Viridothelium virens]
GYKEIVKILLNNSADLFLKAGCNTPLILAAKHAYKRVTKSLLKYGVCNIINVYF